MSARKRLLWLLILIAVSACAGPRYHEAEREPIDITEPLALPSPPAAEHIICPADEAAGVCPPGREYAGYDEAAVDRLIEYRTICRGNTDIAAANAALARALDAEAGERNRSAGELEQEIKAADRRLWAERLGWMGTLALLIWAASL
jgi:hypothetical protein